ncbi:hypothetical protein DYB32_010439 [Aphanomyces invadans]|uniref:CCHC-type domain-containing protein n=1 Tax=Aphanomyces invadans TaxID=157072 RepID=A0A418AFX7_9STRA|nr:hypothetical protein DYB32_010439 [Aphanomyces invadans]
MLGQLGRYKIPAKFPFRLVRKKCLLEDDNMGEDAPYVVHTPAIPQATSFSGLTKQERRAFMRAYQKYVAQVNALQTAGARPFVMPVSACMDHFTKRRVALWDFNRPYDQIAESEWIAWFNMAFEEEPHDLDSSRVSKMLDELMRALERDNQECILYEECKVVVDLMVKAVRPSMLQSAVKKQMQLQRNKPLRTDMFRFVRWLRTFAAGYQMYGGVEDEAKSSKPAKAPDSRVHAPKRPDEKRLDGGAGPAKPRSSDGVARPGAPLATARKPAACLKCKSTDHKVADCPKTTPGEAQDLLAVQMQKWKDAREKAGVATQVVVDDTPTALYPYGKATKPVLLRRRLRLSVALTTTCGPLLLRFSTDALLVNARSLKPEWDMSDSEFLPSADAAVNRVCASRPAVQDFDPEAGMEC